MKLLLIATAIAGSLLAQDQPAAAPPTPAQAAPAAASPVPATEPDFTGYIDLGYRWNTGIFGSVPTYRSIVDLGSGPKMLATEFTLVNPKKKFFDRIGVRAYDWGDD
ncbi:MAG TPA: hypothetical protein VK789_06325, partial [Bryobacteraceae bacterium]|nr:hypothetical protein [Bryobacteraceae bacterium]